MSYTLSRRISTPIKEDGSESFPFLIKTAHDYINLRDDWHNGIGHHGLHFKLANDIDLQGYTFKTIPFATNFYGSFDGNFKAIKNFNISSNNSSSALIANLAIGATVKNLAVINSNVQHTGNYASVISRYVYGTIENCYATGKLTAISGFGHGAIAGALSQYGIIRNCFSNVEITTFGTVYRIGSIVGIIEVGNPTLVENCIALSQNLNIPSTADYVGGILGRTAPVCTLRNCVAAMSSLTGNSNTSGRITGENTGTIINNHVNNTMTLNGVIPTQDIDGSLKNGANATIEQLKSKAFYRDVMGWDMENIWEIDEGNDFPRLKGFNYNF